MREYGKPNGKSGITAYEIGKDYMDIQFRNGKVYRYKKDNVGDLNFLNMVTAALIGCGLNSFINKFVRCKNS